VVGRCRYKSRQLLQTLGIAWADHEKQNGNSQTKSCRKGARERLHRAYERCWPKKPYAGHRGGRMTFVSFEFAPGADSQCQAESPTLSNHPIRPTTQAHSARGKHLAVGRCRLASEQRQKPASRVPRGAGFFMRLRNKNRDPRTERRRLFFTSTATASGGLVAAVPFVVWRVVSGRYC
jgi:hypothetical protein